MPNTPIDTQTFTWFEPTPEPPAPPDPDLPSPPANPADRRDTTRYADEEDDYYWPACAYCDTILSRRGVEDVPRRVVAYVTSRSGRSLCSSCYTRRYRTCRNCGNIHTLRRSTTIQPLAPTRTTRIYASLSRTEPTTLCQTCTSRITTECPACNVRHLVSEMVSTPSGRVCRLCYDASLRTCSRCAQPFYPTNRGALCERCLYISQRPTVRPSPTFTRNPFARSVGIELEFCHPPNQTFMLEPYGGLKGDGSVRPQQLQSGHGREFFSHPMNGDLLLDSISAAATHIRRRGGYVNNTCGYHVHIDVLDLTDAQRNNILNAWITYEDLWFSFVPYIRHESQFCRRLSGRPNARHERYLALNPLAFERHGTFECRMHTGTLSPEKIRNWCLALLYFFEAAKDIARPPTPLERDRDSLIAFYRFANFPLYLRKYLTGRARKFAYSPLQRKTA